MTAQHSLAPFGTGGAHLAGHVGAPVAASNAGVGIIPTSPADGSAVARLAHAGGELRYVDVAASLGEDATRLPVVLRLLVENALRTGTEPAPAVLARFRRWLGEHTSQEETEFRPGRLLMHDTTSTPALVDIAAMRSEVAEAGGDPSGLNPLLPVQVSIDHSLAVESFAHSDAPRVNLTMEYRRNQERYRFLKWAQNAMETVTVNPPGTGIMHTINLEQLATVAQLNPAADGGASWVVPDMMLGTDSHTPMINALGVLGWGVGGLEAQTVMFGLPTSLRIPDVVGVRLTGRLRPGVTATDLALTLTHHLRRLGVAGAFVEYFGPGVSTLTVGERGVVANMAPEYGATTGFFPVDQHTLTYLRETGRSEAAVELVGAYAKAAGWWFDPDAEPEYTHVLDLDLSGVGLMAAGPRRPQDLLDLRDVPAALHSAVGQDGAGGTDSADALHDDAGSGDAGTGSSGDAGAATSSGAARIPRLPVALAAITSCTNTTDPRALIAAGLVARKARAAGLEVPAWVKTSLAPGSPAAVSYLRRAGLTEDLAALGFDIVGFGCTTCIGNSGPLPAQVQEAMDEAGARPVAVLSGNRNFPGRIHPSLDLGLLVSPAVVVAAAIAGRADVDLTTHEFAAGVRLQDLLPTRQEVDEVWDIAKDPEDFARDFTAARRSLLWAALDAPDGELFAWDEASTILRRPPFASPEAGSLLGRYTARALAVLDDDITTDHISPASAIPADSPAADHLVQRGENRADLNVFASRRGNWEVMLRGSFYNKNVVNHLGDRLEQPLPVGGTVHQPDGKVMMLWDAAERYAAEGVSTVIVAGERYGTGSSRDWAAKTQRLLGVRAVLARSYERIHRSNLVGMGILPLRVEGEAAEALSAMLPEDTIGVDASPERIAPRAQIACVLHRADGTELRFTAVAAVETGSEVEQLLAGGVIPSLLASHLGDAA